MLMTCSDGLWGQQLCLLSHLSQNVRSDTRKSVKKAVISCLFYFRVLWLKGKQERTEKQYTASLNTDVGDALPSHNKNLKSYKFEFLPAFLCFGGFEMHFVDLWKMRDFITRMDPPPSQTPPSLFYCRYLAKSVIFSKNVRYESFPHMRNASKRVCEPIKSRHQFPACCDGVMDGRPPTNGRNIWQFVSPNPLS